MDNPRRIMGGNRVPGVVEPTVVGLLYFIALAFGTALADDWISVAGHACVVTVGAVLVLAFLL